MRTGVVQVLALEENPRSAEMRRKSLCLCQRTLASDIVLQDVRKLLLEGGVALRILIGRLQFVDGGHECFGDVLSAVDTVVSVH